MEVDKSAIVPNETTTEPINSTQSTQNDDLVTSATESITESATESVTESVTASDTEETTESATETIECVCDCASNDGKQVKVDCTTQGPENSQTESLNNSKSVTSPPEEDATENSNDEVTTIASNTETDDTIQTTTASPDDTTTVNSIDDETTTTSNTENDDTTVLPEDATTESVNNEDTTTASNTESGDNTTNAPETTTPAPIACSTLGQRQAHELDCQQYYECSSEGSLDGSFQMLVKSCPEKQAFNVELNRCSRDISDCTLPIQCTINSGNIADPTSNSSYYICDRRLIGAGFRVFHVECSSNELYYPSIGKCFIDINNIPTQHFPPPNWEIRDYDIVKAEMKLLKEQDKLKLKLEKAKQKAEEKLQKQLEKEAKKRAKEQEKANKEKTKQEAAAFVCIEEGNHPSAVSKTTYIACINKKGKLKALAMQCGYGATFDAQLALCVNGPAAANSNESDEDNDDDDDDDNDD